MYAWNADSSNNSGGLIWYQITLNLQVKERHMMQNFLVLNLRKWDNIILGYLWLTKNNLWIDWTSGEVHMAGTPVPQHDESEIIVQ